MKPLLQGERAQAALAWAAARYIRLVFATSRWTFLGAEHPGALLAAGRPLIGCFWHGRMLMMPRIWMYPMPMHMLISNHRDGRLIARTIAHLGIRTVSGSSSRGGAAALRAMAQVLDGKAGCVAFTPDGPRGPRMRAAPGIALLAKLTGAPIVPVSYSSSRARVLESWDRFMVALPFGRGVFIWGEPIRVAPDADAAALEGGGAAVEASLNRLTVEADRLCGREPVTPDVMAAGA